MFASSWTVSSSGISDNKKPVGNSWFAFLIPTFTFWSASVVRESSLWEEDPSTWNYAKCLMQAGLCFNPCPKIMYYNKSWHANCKKSFLQRATLVFALCVVPLVYSEFKAGYLSIIHFFSLEYCAIYFFLSYKNAPTLNNVMTRTNCTNTIVNIQVSSAQKK